MTRRSTGSNLALLGGVAIGAGLIAMMALHPKRCISFRNRSIVIIGGSRGLGLVLARELAREGAKIILAARDRGELDRAEDDIASRGGTAVGVECDVRHQGEVEDVIDKAIERYGGVDVLINDAGVIQVGPLDHMTVSDFRRAMDVHFWGPLFAIRAVLPQMRRQGGGRIVNISSIGGKVAVPHLLPYCASKFALTGLSEGLRAELAKENIWVTTACPWLMRTGSYGNATFKGNRSAELSWFALGDSLPMVSIDARRAARKIIEACRRGDARTMMTAHGRLAILMNDLFPSMMAGILSQVAALLPGPTGQIADNRPLRGFDVESAIAPSVLTALSDRAARRNNEVNDGQ